MKMKVSPQTTLDSFREFMEKHDNKPTKDDIRQFVNVSWKHLFKEKKNLELLVVCG